MRNAFAEEITHLAKTDKRIVLLSGDIGNKLFDEFKKVDADRFYNCGIAEANMMSMAAGLSLSGLRSIVYTITPFTTTRCFEQIRVDVCYHNAPVIIVGTGSGLSYADLGPTHHSLEDLAILRTLPGMRVIAPCDSTELRLALKEGLNGDTPVYIRIGKKGEPKIHATELDFKIGKAIKIREGKNVSIIAAGTIMREALDAVEILASEGISASLASMHTIKPLDTEYLQNAASNSKLLVTVEEHGLIGGLGGAVSEWRSEQNITVPHISFGTPDEFMHEVGSQNYARKKYGLTSDNIVSKILKHFRPV